MVFCRNYTAGKNVDPRLIYEMMDALHEIPEILNRWGGDNNADKLREYFGYFDSKKWCHGDDAPHPPDLVRFFDQKLKEYQR